jgi:Cu(I)/Ag(I) efflux system periplasmic protein CusF
MKLLARTSVIIAATLLAAVAAASNASIGPTLAEVKKIDKDAKKITLKHEEIKSLDMPPMTMVFQVKDNAMVEGLKPGDKVKFRAEKTKSGYAVSTIEIAK